MTLIQMTAWGEEHGLINQLPNAVPDTQYKNADPKIKDSLLKRDKDDQKVVKARYVNYEEKEKGRNTVNYIRPGKPIQVWKFIHGYEYTLPMGVVREFNKREQAAQRSGLVSVDGNDVSRNGAPLEKDRFMKIDELIPVSF